MVAADAPLSESMTALLRVLEAKVPGMLGSILLLDKEGTHVRHCAAPSLPSDYIAAIDGQPIGPRAGSCGTAAYQKRPVSAEDIACDPRWKKYRAIAVKHGLRSCWSTPIFDAQGRVLGTFAMYYHRPGLPGPEHRRLTEIATHIAAIAITRDSIQTALRERESKLRESEQLLELVLATLPVGVVVTGPAGNIILANAASKRIWGERIVSGRERWAKSKGFWHDSGERISPSNWASVRALTKGETSLNELVDIETFDGRRKTIQNSAAPIRKAGLIVGAVIVNEDVSAWVRAEDALHASQAELARVARRTMLGELTASISHEINQPLLGVVANANACLQWLAGASPNLAEARKAARHIARDGKRAGDVIAHVRALLQKGQPVRKALNINQLVRTTVTLVKSELQRKSVGVRMRLAPELSRLLADPVQLQQVLMNLILNALDALGEVNARPRVLGIRTARPKPGIVRVEVRDNGIGVGAAQAKRLFELFFTTKNRGLGLGLAISRSIVEAHGGSLWATLNPGHGMTFRFTLPANEGGAH